MSFTTSPLNTSPINAFRRTSRLSSSSSSNASSSSLYFSRLLKFQQMDFEFALWQMYHLILNPKRIYRNIQFYKETKNKWTREDPAFVVLQSLFLSITALLYGIVYKNSLFSILRLIVYMVVVDYLVVGIIVSTFTRLFANNFLSKKDSQEKVEWMYAWDIHCYAFFPTFLATYVFQFFLLWIVTADGFFARFVGCSIYFFGVVSYMYFTFLGFQVLPFVDKAVVFVYPMGAALIGYSLSLIFVNMSHLVLGIYF